MRIETGNLIRWSSAAGILTGIVNSIVLDLNAAGKTIPWMDIQLIDPDTRLAVGTNLTRLCANDSYMKMMKVEVL